MKNQILDEWFSEESKQAETVNLMKKRSDDCTQEYHELDRYYGEDSGRITDKSDYLNASLITLPQSSNQKKIVVTSGPGEEEIDTFWNIVLEQDVHMIACLARNVGPYKECCQYWPPTKCDVIKTDSNIKVTFICSKQVSTNVCMTELQVSRSEESKTAPNSRTVTHLWFDSWPDFGVPDTKVLIRDFKTIADTLINFICDSKQKGRAMIHCRAGLGRSGSMTAYVSQMYMMKTDKQMISLRETVT